MEATPLRDLLYFDVEKASSIYSQFEWGQLQSTSIAEEDTSGSEASASLSIPQVASASAGLDRGERRTVLQTRVIHHDLLNRLEHHLEQAGLLVDLNQALPGETSSPDDIRKPMESAPYVRATGWSVIEDYKRIGEISQRFNDLIEFVARSARQNAKKTPQYAELEASLAEQRRSTKAIKDPTKRALAKAALAKLEESIGALANVGPSKVDEWVINGMLLWISTFIPQRINFRVYPFPGCPSFQVMCNLKRGSFVDQDLEHVLYAYGVRPDIRLTVVGLVTSIPPRSGHPFDPLAEFAHEDQLSNEARFEKAFRGVFRAMEGFEVFVRYSRYPNVTVHPIAVYRNVTGNRQSP